MLIVSPKLFAKLSKHLDVMDRYTELSDGRYAVAFHFPLHDDAEFESFITAEQPAMVDHVHEVWRCGVGEDSYYFFLRESDMRVGVAYNRLQEKAIVYEEILETSPIMCHIACAIVPLAKLAFVNWQARTSKGATHMERRASPWAQ